MNAILSDPDAALDAGWTPQQWENVGFAMHARRRIQEVGELRSVLAALGATRLLTTIREYDNEERVEFTENSFLPD